jgi:hypothetical protein
MKDARGDDGRRAGNERARSPRSTCTRLAPAKRSGISCRRCTSGWTSSLASLASRRPSSTANVKKPFQIRKLPRVYKSTRSAVYRSSTTSMSTDRERVLNAIRRRLDCIEEDIADAIASLPNLTRLPPDMQESTIAHLARLQRERSLWIYMFDVQSNVSDDCQ